MPRKLEIAGRRFGLLSVLEESGRDKHGASMWKCHCDCGRTVDVRGPSLIAGTTKSCGCGVVEAARKPRTHGATHTPLYGRWRAMLGRIGNRKNPEFKNYGGRGITVCDEWLHSFEAFARDMGPTFKEELELERKEVNGPYCKDNCTWATRAEQQRNKRNNHRVEWRGRTMTVQEWGETLGLKPNSIITRLRRGWNVDRALTKDVSNERLLGIAA